MGAYCASERIKAEIKKSTYQGYSPLFCCGHQELLSRKLNTHDQLAKVMLQIKT